jgi:hypothetical protein
VRPAFPNGEEGFAHVAIWTPARIVMLWERPEETVENNGRAERP